MKGNSMIAPIIDKIMKPIKHKLRTFLFLIRRAAAVPPKILITIENNPNKMIGMIMAVRIKGNNINIK